MQGIRNADGGILQTTYRCVDCDAGIDANDLTAGDLVEFLSVRQGRTSERVVSIGGAIVHRCPAPFFTLSA
jgi:hypothetical protein